MPVSDLILLVVGIITLCLIFGIIDAHHEQVKTDKQKDISKNKN